MTRTDGEGARGSSTSVRHRATARVLRAVAAWLPVVVLVLVAVGPALVGARIFLAGDLIESAPPWAETSTVTTVHNQCISDTIDSAMPAQLSFRERLAEGDLLPDFESQPSAGNVLGANPSVGLASPLFLATLPFSDTTFTGWLKVAEIATALAGTVLWARRIGLSTAAGAVGGFLFVTSAYLVMWTNWPQTRTAAFFPLLFWALERIVQDRTVRSALPLPLVVAGLVLGGFPAIVVHTAYVAGVYAIVRLVVVNRRAGRGGAGPAGGPTGGPVRRWLAPPALAVGGGLVALGLVAVQLAPWAAQLRGQDLAYRQDWWSDTIEPQWLLTTLYAQGLGTCGTDAMWWGGRTIPVEAVNFVGAGAVVLVLVALVQRTRVARGVTTVLLVAGLLALVVTYVGGVPNEILHHLPGMGSSRMWRTRAIGGLCFAMLAAIGFDALVHGERPTGRRRAVAMGLAGLTPILLGLAALATRGLSTSPVGWAEVRPSVLLSLASGTLVAALWLTRTATRQQRERTVRLVVALAVPVALAAEGVVAARAWWPLAPTDTLYRPTRTSEWLEANAGEQRIVGVDFTYHGSAAQTAGLRSLSGHGFVPPDWARMLLQADPRIFATQTRTFVQLSDLAHADSPVMDRFGVRYAVGDTGLAAPGELVGFEEVDPERTRPGDEARALVPPGARVRSAAVAVSGGATGGAPAVGADACEGRGRLEVEAVAQDGTVLSHNDRHLTLREEGQHLYNVHLAPVPVEDLDAVHEVVARITGCGTPGLGLVAEREDPWLGLVVDDGDGLTLVDPALTPDAVVYENEGALPRIRWASRALVCDSAASCADRMAEAEDDTVLVSARIAASTDFDGAPGRVDVRRDADDEQIVDVRARGDGMLVVADAVQAGWVAYLDGEPTDLHVVDGAMRGVAVPEGDHRVRLAYEPAGRGVLAPVATLTLAGWLAVAVAVTVRRRS